MPVWLIGLRALVGGLAVVGFSLIGQAGHPKRFAGIFSAAPSVALASLAMTVLAKGARVLGSRWSRPSLELCSARSSVGSSGPFPAVLPATLTLIEKKEGTTKAWADASGGVLGAVGLAAFAWTAVRLLRWNPVVALRLALLAWAVVSVALYFLFRMTGLFLKQDRLLSKSR